MDKTKLVLGSIIGIMLASGIFAYAYDYNAKVTFDDNAVSAYNDNQGKAKGSTFDADMTQKITDMGNDLLYGEQLASEGAKLRLTFNDVYATKDLKTYEAVQQCLDNAIRQKET